MDDIEMRERLGSFGCGKVGLVVVMILEEASLRSDTRLPLESSPYMAGNFSTGDWAAGPSCVNFASTPSPAILFPMLSQYFRIGNFGVPVHFEG